MGKSEKAKEYLVGWCPNCGKVVVVDEDCEPSCGCGSLLLHQTVCEGTDLGDAVGHVFGIMEGAFDETPLHAAGAPSLEDEAKAAREAASALGDEQTGKESIYAFKVKPSPFIVFAVEKDEKKAAEQLAANADELMPAALKAAMMAGVITFNVSRGIPLDEEDEEELEFFDDFMKFLLM